jgi:drug/metabolite transporter (DMT)-like permease
VRSGKFYVFLVLANLFWAGNFLFGSVVVDQLSPFLLTALRWAAAAPLLIVLAIVVERPRWRDALREWPMHLLLAALGLVAFCVFSYEALRHTTPTDAAVVGAINPAIIAVVAGLIAHERVGARRSAGIAVSLLGVLVVISGGDLASLLRFDVNVGHLWMLGAVVVWTGYTILGRRLSTGPVTASAVQATLTTVVLAPFVIRQLGDVALHGPAIGGLLYIAIFPSVLSLVLWNVSVKKVGASTAGVYLNLLPIFTALLGLAVGVPISFATVVGGVLVVLGVTVTSTRKRRVRIEDGGSALPGAASP